VEHKKQPEDECGLFFEPPHRNMHQNNKTIQSSCSIQGNQNGLGNSF